MCRSPRPQQTRRRSKNWPRCSPARRIRSLSPKKRAEIPASCYVNFPRRHHLHAGFEPQEFLQEADVILLLGVIAPWHPASKKLNSGTRVAVLSDNPLRSELPYWGFPVNQILTGDVESSMKHLLEIIKKRVIKSNADAG